jgi:outer membrane protein assembly factor BamB
MRVLHTTRLKGTLVALASGSGSLWVGADDWHLYRLDPRTQEVRQTITLPAVDHLTFGVQRMWVRVSDVSLVGVDPRTGKVLARYTLPSSEIPGGRVVCLANAVWAVNWSDDDVWRIPTRTRQPTSRARSRRTGSRLLVSLTP